jgi:hypothetical protein
MQSPACEGETARPKFVLPVPGGTFRKFHCYFWPFARCLTDRRERGLVAFNAGEGDATRLHHCDHVSGHHDGPRPNRAANERPNQQRRADKQQHSDQQQRNGCRVGIDVFLASCVIGIINIAVRLIVGIVNGDGIGEIRGGNRLRGWLRLGDDLSGTSAVAGGNT